MQSTLSEELMLDFSQVNQWLMWLAEAESEEEEEEDGDN
jgi:hypothetical protein